MKNLKEKIIDGLVSQLPFEAKTLMLHDTICDELKKLRDSDAKGFNTNEKLLIIFLTGKIFFAMRREINPGNIAEIDKQEDEFREELTARTKLLTEIDSLVDNILKSYPES